MSRFHTTERLGTVQSTTREGFLVCEGVPISRTGTLAYVQGEIPRLVGGKDGIVWVTRDDAAVFNEQSIRSFEGKSVVDLHPYEDVTAENWKRYAVGHVQNVRAGTGDQAHVLLADLVIKDAAAIRAVRSGKRHVSCGYDADYEQLGPGRARQTNIVGNHVALVQEGRCGTTCSIGDSAVSLRTLVERLRSSHANKDDQLFATTLAEIDTATAAPGGQQLPGGVTLNITTGDKAAPAAEAAPVVVAQPGTEQQKTNDALAAIATGMEKLNTNLTALEAKVTALETKPATPAVTTTAAVGDSAALKDTFGDVVARAEMLIPGVRAPTFDAAMAPDKTNELICGFQRQVLSASITSGTGRDHVLPVMPAGSEVSAMTCDAVSMVFRGATELARIANNRGTGTTGRPAGGDGKPAVVTAVEINAANQKFWKHHNHPGQAAV